MICCRWCVWAATTRVSQLCSSSTCSWRFICNHSQNHLWTMEEGDVGLLRSPKSLCFCPRQVLITSQRICQRQNKEDVAPKSLQLKWKNSAERVEAEKINSKVRVISSSDRNAVFCLDLVSLLFLMCFPNVFWRGKGCLWGMFGGKCWERLTEQDAKCQARVWEPRLGMHEAGRWDQVKKQERWKSFWGREFAASEDSPFWLCFCSFLPLCALRKLQFIYHLLFNVTLGKNHWSLSTRSSS